MQNKNTLNHSTQNSDKFSDSNLEAGTKMTILSRVAHELKTPLAAILGYAEFIAGQATDLQECRSTANIILDNSDYLLQIIEELLAADAPDNFSGNRVGKSAVKSKRTEVSHLIRGVYRLFANTAASKGLFLTAVYNTPIPRTIVMNAVRVRQILINLISNAIKFTSTGGVRIILSWQNDNSLDTNFTYSSCFKNPETEHANTTSQNDCLMLKSTAHADINIKGIFKISICDSGIGISPELMDDLPRLFLPYQQADSTIKQRFGGTGLGLAIAKRTAEYLGGKINVGNNPDGGAIFSFLLPVKLEDGIEFISDLFDKAAESNIGAANVDAAEVVNSDLRSSCSKISETEHANATSQSDNSTNVHNSCGELLGHRVLLVEDCEELRRLLGLFLSRAGANVTYAESGETAYNFASSEDYDVILMDIGLPLEDGYSVVRRLRDNGYKGQIIAVTADNSLECKEKSQIAGCNNFAAKPIFHDELIKIIKKTMQTQKIK
ncbi:MAG: response regulator [Planctomycetaceae bacterium]|jgi:signal transduction histidine kinase/CheY-like chemotaxis protein|nr:response regulator [Planctomycetaceae bacterium]